MTNEIEVIQADVGVEFPLPNGKSIAGKPVPYPEARRILALLYAFDRGENYEATLQAAINRFTEVAGISEEAVMAACPDLTLGELVGAMQRFFFHQRRAPAPIRPAPTPAMPPPSGA